ncbi:hypothetical protein [Devosia geojensis]|nr:hypothetical protein [Devosia geojensis]
MKVLATALAYAALAASVAFGFLVITAHAEPSPALISAPADGNLLATLF